MTATPRYFTGRVVREAKEADFEVASMDDEATFGPVFHRLGFAEAIERDLLTDYQVVVVGVDDATYRDWAERGRFVTIDGTEVTDARTLAGQIGLAKAMRRYDLHRTITFHSRVKRAREFAHSLPEVIAWMPARQRPKGHLWSDYASGEMPAGQRRALLHLGRLNHGERGLLANARCLAEGVDVPTLDGVAFIDPRRCLRGSAALPAPPPHRPARLARAGLEDVHECVHGRGRDVVEGRFLVEENKRIAKLWEEDFRRLLYYVELNGHARVPEVLHGRWLQAWCMGRAATRRPHQGHP